MCARRCEWLEAVLEMRYDHHPPDLSSVVEPTRAERFRKKGEEVEVGGVREGRSS